MAQNNPKSKALKEWLEEKSLGQFYDKLYEKGVESLDDLRILKKEEEVMELAGPDGINMSVIYRRKFINCVLELNNNKDVSYASYEEKDVEEEEENNDESNNEDNNNNNNNNEEVSNVDATSSNSGMQRRNSIKMSKSEEQSLTQLVQQIRTQTQHLQSCKTNLTSLRTQFGDSKKALSEQFDKAMSALIVRRKQLEGALESAEVETIGKLEERIKDSTKFAQTLLACKAQVEGKLKNSGQSVEREQYVVNEVNKSLSYAPKEDVVAFNLVFDQGEITLINFIEKYGSVAVGKKKGKTPAPEES